LLHPEKKSYKSEKLGATFQTRKKYVVHYRNLQLYIKLGMRLVKVHRVLTFSQSNFLKIFIDQCTRLRQESQTDFGKRLWKLMANSVFGKLIEDVRKYLDCKIVQDEKLVRKLLASPRYKSMKILHENLVLIFLNRTSIRLNKGFAIGFSILEMSKFFMYQQYYEVIKPALGDCTVLMSDTDSLMLSVRSKEPEEHLIKLRHIIDFSNYPREHPLFSAKNKNQLGFWKSELEGGTMLKFCGLRSKTYAFVLENGESGERQVNSKCKGITRAYKKKITFENYLSCLQSFNKFSLTQYQIRAKNHNIFTAKIDKLCFSSFDDKRYLLECGIHSLPYGSTYIDTCLDKCPECAAHNPLEN
jgi:hypothetical protein